jgi:hypothetical protein
MLPSSPAFTPLRQGVSSAISTGRDVGLEPHELDGLNTAVRALADRAIAADDSAVVRPLRVIQSVLDREADMIEAALVGDIVVRLEGRRSPDESAHERYAEVRQEISRLRRASDIMSAEGRRGAGGPEPGPRWTRLCSRLLRLGQDLARPDGRTQLARDEIRLLLGLVESLYPSADSPVLAESSAIGRTLLGEQRARLGASLDDTRLMWLGLLDQERDEQARGSAAVLAAGAEVVALVESLSPLVRLWERAPGTGADVLGTINADAGIELGLGVVSATVQALPGELQRAAALVAQARAEDAQTALRSLQEIRESCSVLAALASWTPADGPTAPTGSIGAWGEIAGIERLAWTDPARARAARLSLALHEWQRAKDLGDAARVDSWRGIAQNLAARAVAGE